MSVSKEELIRIIEDIAPKELMESWDNTGIQVDVGPQEINRILVCLDVCSETIEEAIQEDCEFIVSHHPLLFSPVRRVSKEEAMGRYLIRLIKNNISVYASHTSFDSVQGGNNDFLAEKLRLRQIRIPEETPIMRVGVLPSAMSLSRFCELVDREIMGLQGLRYAGSEEKQVKTVGICTGAGADLMDAALMQGCDVLVTGDVKYHEFQQAEQKGIALVDAGHYETEIFFNGNMAEKLQKALGDKARVIPSKMQSNALKKFTSMI